MGRGRDRGSGWEGEGVLGGGGIGALGGKG